jgi:two-component system, NtrC family, sensor kinase
MQIVNDELDAAERSEVVEEIEQLLSGIAEGVARAGGIVRELRAFSRLDEDAMKLADLREGITSMVTLLRPRLAPDVDVRVDIETLPAVDCRPGQINQALMNILVNAIDAVAGHGAIRVAAEHDATTVRIAISDDGCGMTTEQMARIFEPFYTTKEVGQGTGLGLAITHTIIDQHGGSIIVESEVGKGTTVIVSLPRQGAASGTARG